jgi:hypothetical protein
MVLIVCARAPSHEATWCLSTPVVARPTPAGVPNGFAPSLRSEFAFEHQGTGRFITWPTSTVAEIPESPKLGLHLPKTRVLEAGQLSRAARAASLPTS